MLVYVCSMNRELSSVDPLLAIKPSCPTSGGAIPHKGAAALMDEES